MQIDFHYCVTYVLARLAGFNHNDADIISTSAQYVDDNNCLNIIKFDNCALYNPILSAHKKLDYTNFDELANRLVWIPFHFLPGNCKSKFSEKQVEPFQKRLICNADSNIANEMVDECINRASDLNALYRLGITMHVYADTWAHQGFSGIRSDLNSVSYCEDDTESKELVKKVETYFGVKIANLACTPVSLICPLGHGAVLSYPDMPYLRWKYKNCEGKMIVRDNPSEFIDAAQKMYIAMEKFKSGKSEPLKREWVELLHKYFTTIVDSDKDIRYKKWQELLAKGAFGLEPVRIEYDENKWELEAFDGMPQDRTLQYTEKFANSNWKKFNDALKDHHYYLTCKLFPKFGLCVI